MFEGGELSRLAILANGVQVAYFTVLNNTSSNSICIYILHFLAKCRRGQKSPISIL